MRDNLIIEQLKNLFSRHENLRQTMLAQLATNAADNPDLQTNPVRSLDDLYLWFNRMLTSMPWMGLEQGAKSKEQGLFRRIDQSIGYAYYLFGDLQYEPQIAEWIKQYNARWGEFLDSSESWNNEYFEMLKQDPLFELDGDKYESPDNWHCWNDFFARRLGVSAGAYAARVPSETDLPFVAEGKSFPWLPIQDNTLAIKTARIDDITDLLGDSPYKREFENGRFTHITLDIFNYHRFHSPVDGRIVDIQEIDGQLSAGGRIIWDGSERRYRYEQADNIGFQMIEKRVVIVIEAPLPPKGGAADENSRKDDNEQINKTLIAVIPVGVAQVGSIRLNDDIKIGAQIKQGQEMGCFRFGGSDVVIMRK